MATQPKTKAGLVPALKVRSCSPSGTFRRGGQAFDHEPRTIPLSDLTADQIKAIRGERLLVVEEVEIEAPGEDGTAT